MFKTRRQVIEVKKEKFLGSYIERGSLYSQMLIGPVLGISAWKSREAELFTQYCILNFVTQEAVQQRSRLSVIRTVQTGLEEHMS